MQFSTGTVQLTQGSPVVIALAGVNWSTVKMGALFVRQGQPVNYQVAADAAVNNGGQWQLSLTVPYAGVTEAAGLYTLQTSFTAHGLPIWNVGDTQTVALINRMVQALESMMAGLPTSGGLGGASTNVNLDANGNLQIKNTTTNAWRYPIYQGQPGAETFVAVDSYVGAALNWTKDASGNLKVLNVDTGQYRYIFFNGAAGSETAIGTDSVS